VSQPTAPPRVTLPIVRSLVWVQICPFSLCSQIHTLFCAGKISKEFEITQSSEQNPSDLPASLRITASLIRVFSSCVYLLHQYSQANIDISADTLNVVFAQHKYKQKT
jgi:hypothetical protein